MSGLKSRPLMVLIALSTLSFTGTAGEAGRVSNQTAPNDENEMVSNFPQAPMALPSGSGVAEFHVVGDIAVLTVREPSGAVTPLRVISDVSDALAVLADKRLSFAWPALLTWSGADLSALRDRALARSKMAAEAGILGSMPKGQFEKWVGDDSLSAFMHYVRELKISGHQSVAISTLKQRLALTPVDAEHAYARVFIILRLATDIFDSGDVADSLSMMENAYNDHSLDGDYKLNINVTFAMLLVRAGQPERGLTIIEDARSQFDAEASETADSFKVPSSEANFAWIKACALDRMGRREEARKLIDEIDTAKAWPQEESVTSLARVYAFLCMKDDNGLAGELASQLKNAAPADDVFTMIQPESNEYGPDAAVTAAAVRRPELAAEIAARARLLSPDFRPALEDWRTEASKK